MSMSVNTTTDSIDSASEVISAFRNANTAEYGRIASRINGLRGYFLASDPSTQKEILKKSYVYSALTANTAVQFADESYGRWIAGEDIRRSTYATAAITNQKGEWIHSTLDRFDEAAEPVLEAMRRENWYKAGELCAEQFKGVARIKGHFTIALISGKTACLDTHTVDFLNKFTDMDTIDKRSVAKQPEVYKEGVKRLKSTHDGLVFMSQWVAFDYQKSDKQTDLSNWVDELESGSIETHDLFYDSLPMP